LTKAIAPSASKYFVSPFPFHYDGTKERVVYIFTTRNLFSFYYFIMFLWFLLYYFMAYMSSGSCICPHYETAEKEAQENSYRGSGVIILLKSHHPA
jgi:hypothetical protein